MDEKIASAIRHWAPRFTTNGVSVSDFQKVTGGLERWEDWCDAWSSVAAEHESLGRTALDAGRLLSAGEHLAQAAVCFHFGKFLFVDYPQQMREAHRRAVRCLTDALPHLAPPGRRVEIDFEDGRIVGILRCPQGDGPHPTVIMLPGLDSTKEELRTTEETFLARGLATFSVDGPGQGEAEYDIAIRADWSSPAEAIVESLGHAPEVDLDRIGVWGVSLGGYYAPRVAAALGERVKACVALSGPYNFGDCWDRLPQLTRKAFEVRSRAADQEDAHRIAATLDLDAHAAGITAPLLVVFGRQDRLIPWQHAERLAQATGGEVEVLMLESGNHGCANVASWHRPYTADWLATTLSRRCH